MATEDLRKYEIVDLIAGFAAKNPEYRKALLANPKEILAKQM